MIAGSFPGIAANVQATIRAGRPTDLQEVIVKYSGDIAGAVAPLGGYAEILNTNYAIVTLPLGQLLALYSLPEVLYVELPRTLTFVLSRSLSHACITYVQSETGYNLKGDGVLVGIIDSGIDYTHPDFRNPDGTTRIAAIWDQTIRNGVPPPGFLRGAEYTREQIDYALQQEDPFRVVPSRDDIGHGTAVAGVASGNGRASNFVQVGTAPEATLLIVKLGGLDNSNTTRSTEIMRALTYMYAKAAELNMPLSINISYGTNLGGHDGDSLFETFIDDMAEEWKSVISVATGNEGATGHHFGGRATETTPVTVEFTTSGNVQEILMPLWKDFADTFTYELISPSGRTTGVLLPVQGAVNVVLDGTMVDIYFGQPTHNDPEQEIFISLRGQNGRSVAPGIWTLTVRGTDVVDGRFDIWLPTADIVSTDTTFLQPDTNTTLTIPSTAYGVIAVGGYNSLLGNIADFSGRGFTARNRVYVKPDLVAPAVAITTPRAGGGYDVQTGTSMAVPFVTGSAALMMQWGILDGNDPFLYGQRVKAFLRKGARRELPTAYPNPLWGYGTLCLNDTMNLLVEYLARGGPA